MISVTKKTLQDLEFNTILETIAAYCNTELGNQKALAIEPFKHKAQLLSNLKQTSEYQASFTNNNAIPNHGFETISNELKFLGIEDSFLEAQSFKKLAHVAETAITLIKYFKKFEDYYPELNKKAIEIAVEKQINIAIDNVFDKYGEIKNNASPDLVHIRKNIQVVRGKINQSFGLALTQYNSAGYLDDIKETIVENRRVLAVLAMYRKKVKGSVMGSSKTGSIVYIEPEATLRYSRELADLLQDEREEIVRILKQLTNEIRSFKENLA